MNWKQGDTALFTGESPLGPTGFVKEVNGVEVDVDPKPYVGQHCVLKELVNDEDGTITWLCKFEDGFEAVVAEDDMQRPGIREDHMKNDVATKAKLVVEQLLAEERPGQTISLRDFDDSDWAAFQGAEEGPGGVPPAIGDVTVDGEPANIVVGGGGMIGIYGEGGAIADYGPQSNFVEAKKFVAGLPTALTRDQLLKLGFDVEDGVVESEEDDEPSTPDTAPSAEEIADAKAGYCHACGGKRMRRDLGGGPDYICRDCHHVVPVPED